MGQRNNEIVSKVVAKTGQEPQIIIDLGTGWRQPDLADRSTQAFLRKASDMYEERTGCEDPSRQYFEDAFTKAEEGRACELSVAVGNISLK